MGFSRSEDVQARSNVVPLFDIRNLRWRRYTNSQLSSGCNISSRDSFVKSLAAAERRHIISACTTENDDSRGGSAEDGSSRASSRCLWIFWFGDEPILKDVLSDDLRETEVGCWERGVSTQCVRVLCDALKAYVERSLLTVKGDIRLGKYIATGLRNREYGNSIVLLSLQVFLMGTYYLSLLVDVLQACTPLQPVTSAALLAASASADGLPVRLSPSGLPARLHGASVQSDRRSLKCLETWRSFYPVPNCSPDVNNVVDISIAGIHMTYPTALVLLTTGALDKHVDESTLPLSDLTALCPAAVPAASAAYEYGVRHTATHELATVDRLANRLHSDMVYTGSKQRRRSCVAAGSTTGNTLLPSSTPAAQASSPAGLDSGKRPANRQSFTRRLDKRSRQRTSSNPGLAFVKPTSGSASGAVTSDSHLGLPGSCFQFPTASKSNVAGGGGGVAASIVAAVNCPSRPASRLSCRFSSAASSTIPSPFLAAAGAAQKEVDVVALIEKAAQGSPSAAVAAATVPSSQQQGSSSLPVATVAAAAAAATLSPAVDGSLAHVPSLFAGSTLRRHDDRVATIASPTSNIPTSVERQPFESPAASNLRPPPSAASCTSRELSSDVQTPRPPTPQSSHAAIAAKLVGLYKLPAVNDVAVNHLSPWFVDVSGVDGKLPVPSILTSTAASHSGAGGVSTHASLTAIAMTSLCQLVSDQILTPPSDEDRTGHNPVDSPSMVTSTAASGSAASTGALSVAGAHPVANVADSSSSNSSTIVNTSTHHAATLWASRPTAGAAETSVAGTGIAATSLASSRSSTAAGPHGPVPIATKKEDCKDYTQIESITISRNDFEQMFSDESGDEESTPAAATAAAAAAVVAAMEADDRGAGGEKTPFKPGSIPQSGFESSAQRPPSLTTDRSFSGVSMVAAVGASAGPSLVEDCELGRMFPTPPSTSTADSSVTTTAAGSANSLPGAILPGGSVLSAPGYYAVGSASAGATSPGVPHFQGSQYYSLSGGGSSSYTSTAYMDTSQQHQLNEQQQQQQHQQHQQQQQMLQQQRLSGLTSPPTSSGSDFVESVALKMYATVSLPSQVDDDFNSSSSTGTTVAVDSATKGSSSSSLLAKSRLYVYQAKHHSNEQTIDDASSTTMELPGTAALTPGEVLASVKSPLSPAAVSAGMLHGVAAGSGRKAGTLVVPPPINTVPGSSAAPGTATPGAMAAAAAAAAAGFLLSPSTVTYTPMCTSGSQGSASVESSLQSAVQSPAPAANLGGSAAAASAVVDSVDFFLIFEDVCTAEHASCASLSSPLPWSMPWRAPTATQALHAATATTVSSDDGRGKASGQDRSFATRTTASASHQIRTGLKSGSATAAGIGSSALMRSVLKSRHHLQSLLTITDEALRLKQLQPHTLALSNVQQSLIANVLQTCCQRSTFCSQLDEDSISGMVSKYELHGIEVLSASHCQLHDAVEHVHHSLSVVVNVLQAAAASTAVLPVMASGRTSSAATASNVTTSISVTTRQPQQQHHQQQQLPTHQQAGGQAMAWNDLKSCLPGTNLACYQLGIPAFLVGYENDLVSASPFVLPYWEKLVLQSVTPQCRLHYVALVTEDSSVDYDLCRTFFRDVSYVFKDCHFGGHSPLRYNSHSEAVVIVDSKSIRKRLSEMMECMERVLARCRPEAVDNMDYQSMQSDDLSDQLVLYLVMPSRRVHSSSQQHSAPAATATGSTASSASAAKEGERCMEIVLDWINQLEPAFRRHSIQIQIVLDSQVLDGVDMYSRPCQPSSCFSSLSQSCTKVDTGNTVVWSDGSRQLAANVFRQAMDHLTDATRFEALTDFATSTERHKLLCAAHKAKVSPRLLQCSPFVLAPSSIAWLRSSAAAAASSRHPTLQQPSPSSHSDVLAQRERKTGRSATSTPIKELLLSTSSPAAASPASISSTTSKGHHHASSAASESSHAGRALGGPAQHSSSSSSRQDCTQEKQASVLYCSYGWVEGNTVCASLMDSTGQQQRTLTLKLATPAADAAAATGATGATRRSTMSAAGSMDSAATSSDNGSSSDGTQLTVAYQELFNSATKFISHTLLSWKFVFCHVGPLSAEHISAWQEVLSSKSISAVFDGQVWAKCGACQKLPSSLQPDLLSVSVVSVHVPASLQLTIDKDLTSSDKLHQHQEQDVSPSVLSGSSAATSNSACHDSGSSLPWAELCVLDTHSVADKQSMTAAAAASATAAASSLFHSLPVQLGMLSPSTLPGAAAPVAAASSTLLHTGSVPCNTAHIPAAAAALGTLGAGATLSVHQQQTVGLEAGSLHNPFAAMMPSPNSPGLAEGMLAAFGMTSPTTASTSGSRAATTAGGATGGEAGYHPISTLHMDMLGSAGTAAAAAGTISSASLGGGGGTPSSMSAAAASTYGLSGLMHGTAGIAGVAATAGPPVKIGKTSSGIAAGAHKNSPAQAAAVCPPPLAMSWLATNLELDLASAFYLNYSRLTGAGNATLLQSSLHIHKSVQLDQRCKKSPSITAVSSAPSQSSAGPLLYTDVLRRVMEDFYSQCWLSCGWSASLPSTCLPPHITNVTRLAHALIASVAGLLGNISTAASGANLAVRPPAMTPKPAPPVISLLS
ncbi:uncharacterized protein LOC135828914 isoform X2 [Sycon ciliatum]|uniref:uncharacterized protein LOC135828914 isoform X2 n=1 Tax=Sycon ciliatum TaxID=27933 RepID=UPI0031F6F154